MLNKFVTITSLILFWVFLPVGMMYLNLSGFTSVNNDLVNQVTADDFNVFTFSGISTFFTFIIGLAKYSVTGLPIIFNVMFAFFGLISIIVLFFVLREG